MLLYVAAGGGARSPGYPRASPPSLILNKEKIKNIKFVNIWKIQNFIYIWKNSKFYMKKIQNFI